MSDIEERPSKIRKVELQSDSNDVAPVTLASANHEEETDESSGQPKEGGNGGDNDILDASNEDGAEEKPTLSKNQLKKIRKREQWDAGKDNRRLKRKEKHKEKQARKAEERAAAAQEKSTNGEPETIDQPPVPEKRKGPRRPIQVPVSLIMDCDFDELMTEKELISLGAQLTRCYSENRSNPYRSHMAISSWKGTLKTRFETVLTNNHLSWKGVRFMEGDFVAAAGELDGVMKGPEGGKLAGAFSEDRKDLESAKKHPATNDTSDEPLTTEPAPLENGEEPATTEEPPTEPADSNPTPSIVYLTSDSPHTLDRLSPNTSYIIGGIVDKNRHKGICYKRACERGIPTAKLPIGEYMMMQSRSVLAVNHVAEIMLRWLETGDWGEAFLSVIPKRKEAKLRFGKDGSVVSGGEATLREEEAEDGGGDEDEVGLEDTPATVGHGLEEQ